jgi:phosphoribosylanthranilate isomerase
VGVFVNATYDEIGRTIDKYRLNMAQLHGDEPAEFCALVRKLCPVIKAVSVESVEDIKQAPKLYATAVDYLLFDTRTPIYGGAGKKFDWRMLDYYSEKIPFFLSGGIGANDYNLNEIKLPAGFHAVDVNSRFETAPALKDIKLLTKFFNHIQNQKL